LTLKKLVRYPRVSSSNDIKSTRLISRILHFHCLYLEGSPPHIKPHPIESVPPVPVKVESTASTTNSSKPIETSKTNGGTADDMLMEEMLLEEEKEQTPVKSIDLDSLTIPEISTQKIDVKEEPIKIITTTATVTSIPSLTPSPTKKPYTLYKVPHTNHTTPPLSSRHKKQIKKDSSITRKYLILSTFHR
jgi:hypothetical protein